MAAAVLLFAFSTMISWSYYGLKCWTYLFGEGKGSEISYKVIICIFVVIGCSASLGPVIDFSDAAIFAMSITNVKGVCKKIPPHLIKKQDLTPVFSLPCGHWNVGIVEKWHGRNQKRMVV